jgi:hypothetical protein
MRKRTREERMSLVLSRKRLFVIGSLLMLAASLLVVATAPAEAHQIVLDNARCEFMVDVTDVTVLADTDPAELDNWTVEPDLTIGGSARIDVWTKEKRCVQVPVYTDPCPRGSDPACVQRYPYLNPADGIYYGSLTYVQHCWYVLKYLGHRDTRVFQKVIGSMTFEGDPSPDPYWLDEPVGTEQLDAPEFPNHKFKIQLIRWNRIEVLSVAVQARENDAAYSDSGTSGALTWTVVDPCDPFGGFLASYFGPLSAFPTAPIYAGDNDTWTFPVPVKKATPRGQANAETDGLLLVNLEMRSEPYWRN